eukprot:jgi/Mesvir1/9745/Mv12208-RA.1
MRWPDAQHLAVRRICQAACCQPDGPAAAAQAFDPLPCQPPLWSSVVKGVGGPCDSRADAAGAPQGEAVAQPGTWPTAPASEAAPPPVRALADAGPLVAATSKPPMAVGSPDAGADAPPRFERNVLAAPPVPSRVVGACVPEAAGRPEESDALREACRDAGRCKLWLRAVEAARLLRSEVNDWLVNLEDLEKQITGCFVRVKLNSVQARGAPSPYIMTKILAVQHRPRGDTCDVLLRVDRKAELVNVIFLSDQPFSPEELRVCMKEDRDSFTKETMLAAIRRKQALQRQMQPRVSQGGATMLSTLPLAQEQALADVISFLSDTTSVPQLLPGRVKDMKPSPCAGSGCSHT